MNLQTIFDFLILLIGIVIYFFISMAILAYAKRNKYVPPFPNHRPPMPLPQNRK